MVQDVRGLNRRAVLAQLLTARPSTRKEIGARAGISTATVTRVVDGLIDEGVVVEGEEIAVETRGRRARPVDLDARRSHVVGVDLGASSTRVVLLDLVGRAIRADAVATVSGRGAADLAGWIADVVTRVSHGARPRPSRVSVGVPGAVDRQAGTISNAPNLPEIQDHGFVAMLRARIGVPVDLDNDTNLALIGEQIFGAARETPNAAMLTIGAGLGSALAIDGRLVRGRHGLVGEFGQLPFGPNGEALERSVTGPGILAQARADGLDFASPAEMFQASWGPWRARFDEGLLTVLGALTVSCEPERIVLGGGISQSLAEDLPRYRAQLEERLRYAPELVVPELGDFSGAVGAAVNALHAVYRELGLDDEDGVERLPGTPELDLDSLIAARPTGR